MNVSFLYISVHLLTALHLVATNYIGGAASFMSLFQSELLSLPKFTFVISLLVTVRQFVVIFIGLTVIYVVRLFLWTLYFSLKTI
jgi:hypothetical protein